MQNILSIQMKNCDTNILPKVFSNQNSKRSEILSLISNFKGKNSNFHRQTQFIAYSIIDKLHEENCFIDETKNIKMQSNQRLAACSILLASKFNDVHKLKVKDVLSFFSNKKITHQQILETQSQTLQCINFTIPCETAYSCLSKRVNIQTTKTSTSSSNLLKSMKLLIASIRQYPVLVLDPKFGDEIYDAIWNKQVNQRINQIYKAIKQKYNQTENCQLKVNTSNTCIVQIKA